MEVDESGDKRPNFSAISNNSSSLNKLPTNSPSIQSDIRKLVIKNFKGTCIRMHSLNKEKTGLRKMKNLCQLPLKASQIEGNINFKCTFKFIDGE